MEQNWVQDPSGMVKEKQFYLSEMVQFEFC